MKRHFLALLLSMTMIISLLPVTAMAEDNEDETPSEVTDIDGHVWQVATEDNTITMTSEGEKTTITLTLGEDGVLTVTGNGAMPNLDPSTDSESGSNGEFHDYPWWNSFNSATKIVVGDGITSIGTKSFIAWGNVTEVSIGKDVTDIGAGALAQLTACTQFEVAEGNTAFKAVDGVLYNKGQTKLYYYPSAKADTSFDVPEAVTEIGYNAICRNETLTEVTFTGTGELTLGYGSMFNLKALQTLTFKSSQITLNSLAFSGDEALEVIYCADSAVKAEIIANKDIVKYTGNVLLEGGGTKKDENGVVYLCDSEEATVIGYEGVTGSDVDLVIPDTFEGAPVTSIADAKSHSDNSPGVFEDKEFKSIEIGKNVKRIGDKAFLHKSKNGTLQNVTIKGENIEFGWNAFFRSSGATMDMTAVKEAAFEFRAFYVDVSVIASEDALATMKEELAKMMDMPDQYTTYKDFKVYVGEKSENEPYWAYSKTEQKWSYTNGRLSVQSEGYNGNYDGAEHFITVTAVEGIEVTYSTDGTTYSEKNPTFTNAGNKVYFKASKDSNDLVGFAYVTIAKIEPQLTIIATPDSLRGGGKVTLTVTGAPEEGNVTVTCDNGITVDSENGTYFAVLPNRTESYTFTANYAESTNYTAASAVCTVSVTRRYSSSTTVTPEPEPMPEETVKFADVSTSAYYYDAVKWAVENGVTDGLSDTMFGPYESCTRAQIVTFLWRAAGSPEPKTVSSFSDVPANAYYAKAVAWAVENGITKGMTETMFAPNETCTRGQSVTFLYRALKGTASGSANFTDIPANAFYADAVNWAVANNVTNGTSNTTFSPNADCTRAEIVTFLYRAYQGK